MKEDNGRDSPAEYSEPVDGGTEVILKLRLSSSFADTKLTVYSKDTIGQCKKKLQVRERERERDRQPNRTQASTCLPQFNLNLDLITFHLT